MEVALCQAQAGAHGVTNLGCSPRGCPQCELLHTVLHEQAVVHIPLPMVHIPLPIVHIPLPIVHIPLPLVHTPLPIVHIPLPIAHIPLLLSASTPSKGSSRSCTFTLQAGLPKKC